MNEGDAIGGYRLRRRIGAGGMGEVWLAEHALLGRRAAIKLLHPMFSSRTDIVTRFFNEARAAAAIADPGIVQIFDFGQLADGTGYIVMELLDGETLHARSHYGPMAIADALRIVRQVASSLGAAHARGIVHRDLKPENIFLVRDAEVAGGERAKILDFGIAKLSDETSLKTQTSVVMGTPAFMSPEQCRGAGGVDSRSDVYALGCVLFTIIAGRLVFDAEGAGEIIAMHLREPPPRLSSLRADISPGLDALLVRCLHKDPAHRYRTGRELAAAIGELLGLAPAAVAPTAPPSIATAPAATTLSGSAASVLQPTHRRLTHVGLAGGLVLAIAAVTLTLAMRSSRERGLSDVAGAPPDVAAPNATAPSARPSPPFSAVASPGSAPHANATAPTAVDAGSAVAAHVAVPVAATAAAPTSRVKHTKPARRASPPQIDSPPPSVAPPPPPVVTDEIPRSR